MRVTNGGGWKNVRVVFKKEMLETIRDTRTLMIMVVVPVLLYPALLIASEQLALFGRRQLAREPSPVGVSGEVDSAFVVFLAGQEGMYLRDVEDPEWAIRSDSISTVAVFSVSPGPDESRSVLLLYDAADDQSRRGRDALAEALLAWRDTLLVRRVSERGLPEGFARPLVVADSSVALPGELGGYALGRFLPILLVMMTLLGTFYPAIDLAAGEKERGTLETLLTAPVDSGQVVAGKFLTVTVVGLLSAALNLASMLLTFQTGMFQLGQATHIEFSLPFTSVLVIFGMLFPLAVLFGSLFLGVALRSRSFKEAQNALTPIYMIVIVPTLLPLFPGIEISPALALTPIAGVVLLFRELMGGDATFLHGSLALLSTLVYASGALVFAARSFGREEVLFGTGGDDAEDGPGLGIFRGLRYTEPLHDRPGPRGTLALIAVIAVLFFYLAARFQVGFGEHGLLVSEVLLLLVPSLLFLRLGGFDPVRTLSLRAPSGKGLLAAVLIIAGGTPLVWFLTWLQSLVFPMPVEFLEGMSDFLSAQTLGRTVWLLFLVAFVPAICEETLFRGVLLGGTRGHLTSLKVVLLNGIVFGLFHVPSATVFRLLPSASLGILLAWVVLRTRSIWPGMLMHFLNNGSMVILATSPWILDRFSDPGQGPPFWLLIPALASLLAGAALLEGSVKEEAERGRGVPEET